ncbi:hypothetical protein BJ742DRAFT_839062 [Cladochytrium replicatum]|nr:hypothetical protein BJ742DRAFT_839062 [Cladochytrium replicatum]
MSSLLLLTLLILTAAPTFSAFTNITTQSFTFPYTENNATTQLSAKLTTANGVNGPFPYAILLLHGADGDMDSNNVLPLAEHLTALHGIPVLRFNQLSGKVAMRALQASAGLAFLKTKVDAQGYIPVGRSLGSRVVAQMMASGGIGVCLAYPMLGDDDTSANSIVDRRLLVTSMRPDAKVLFVIGSADTLTSLSDLDKARTDGGARTWRATITGANHALKLPVASYTGSAEGKDLWATIVTGVLVGWIKDIGLLSPPVASWEVNGWTQGGDCVVNVTGGVETTSWAGSAVLPRQSIRLQSFAPGAWAHAQRMPASDEGKWRLESIERFPPAQRRMRHQGYRHGWVADRYHRGDRARGARLGHDRFSVGRYSGADGHRGHNTRHSRSWDDEY